MMDDKIERISTRKSKLVKALYEYRHHDVTKLLVEYLYLSLDSRVNVLLTASGEEAVAIRGEMRAIKSLLSTLNQHDASFTDSISKFVRTDNIPA